MTVPPCGHWTVESVVRMGIMGSDQRSAFSDQLQELRLIADD
jgi:hypothetical protein